MIKENYDVILFDLDGTLTDPKPGITKAFQYSLKFFGIIEEDLDDLEKVIGPPLADSFKEFYGFDDGNIKLAIDKYREYYSVKGLLDNRVYPHIPILLKKLNDKGKDLRVATSKPTFYANKILDHFKIAKYFSSIVGSNFDGTRVKKEEVIAYALKQKGLKTDSKIVMIGDRKFDILGAKKVGIDSIGVLYGYGSREELNEENPTNIVESVADLEKLLL